MHIASASRSAVSRRCGIVAALTPRSARRRAQNGPSPNAGSAIEGTPAGRQG
jgi:hypothetical protein